LSALKTAQLPEFRLDNLRHTYASLLLGGGRADHLHERAARPSQSVDDAPVLREVDSAPGTALGQSARPGRRDDRTAIGDLGIRFGTNKWNQKQSATPDALEVANSFGGPSRTRTLDPLI